MSVTNVGWYGYLCENLSCVPTRQGGTKTTGMDVGATTNTQKTLGNRIYGFYHLFTQVRVMLHYYYGRGLIFKYVVFIPRPKEGTIEVTAHLFLNVIKYWGIPKTIVSNLIHSLPGDFGHNSLK